LSARGGEVNASGNKDLLGSLTITVDVSCVCQGKEMGKKGAFEKIRTNSTEIGNKYH
jgi:hypothetical protein